MLLLGFLCQNVMAMPHVMLKNGGNKCIKVDVVRDMVLLVDYRAPDLVLTDDDTEEDKRQGKDGDENAGLNPEDGADARYNQRRKRKVRGGLVLVPVAPIGVILDRIFSLVLLVATKLMTTSSFSHSRVARCYRHKGKKRHA